MYKVADFADLHSELKLPKEIAAKVRKWVDSLDWPEGSEKEDRRNYHITILSIDNDDEDFRDWMTEEMKGKTFDFETTGLDIFAEEWVVLRLDGDQWKNLTVAWGEKAYRKGLEPRRFPGGPKAHITVGKLGEKKTKPQGIQNPGLKFTTGEFNINRNSAFHQASDLKRWLDSIADPAPQPLSPYHQTAEDFAPQVTETQLGIPAPDFKPDPYVWQDDGRVEHPELNRAAASEIKDYDKSKEQWYDRAWRKNPIPEEGLEDEKNEFFDTPHR